MPKGDAMAEQLDYVPLPDSVVTLLQGTWKKSILSQGKPIWPAKQE